MTHDYKHLFGPVPSRRLGRSLGVDVVPYKTCSFDCVFCQLGRTTNKTVNRREYVPANEIIEELDNWLNTNGSVDFITLSGSGEPTLHSDFEHIIEYLRKMTSIPLAVLTNGSLLDDPDVRAQAAQASVVKVSLSAWDQFSLERINRPHTELTFDRIFNGQRSFREMFSGEIWMEVFCVGGFNTTTKDVSRIAELAKLVEPDRIQLNTAVRPPCEAYAYALPQEQMAQLTELFDPPAEIIAEYTTETDADVRADEDAIRQMLERRPCTVEEICNVFGLHRNEALKYIGKLLRTGYVEKRDKNGQVYYVATGPSRSKSSASG